MDFVQSASGARVLAIGGSIAYLLLLLWAWQPDQIHRRSILIAATGIGVIIFIANQIAQISSLWDWWGYSLPLLLQVGLLLLLPSILFTFILLGYHWLVAHTRNPLLWYALVGIIVLVPLTVLGDLYNLARGNLAFRGGYTIWQDVVLGQVFFWLPVVFYQIVQRRAQQTSL